jgi:hypothetical protein
MTTLVVLQPGYLPWLGYFDLLNKANVFVHCSYTMTTCSSTSTAGVTATA